MPLVKLESTKINKDDPAYLMKIKLDQQYLELKRKKYDLILDFMNKLFKTNNKSLRDFNYIKRGDFKDIDHVRNVISEYESDIVKKLKITTYILDDKIAEDDIIDLLKDIIKTINYNVKRKNMKDYHYYYISDK